jgi:hypothetical protein
MPVNFTDSPSNGDTIIGGGLTYTYVSANSRWETATGGLNTEEVQDVVGAMFSSNTETGITATYQDSDGTVDLVASGGGLTTTVYATMALLIAATGMSTGDLAYVTANNNLYLYSVNGWFLVATVSNASPTAITGVSAAYTLASDGTATVITAVSTDPEGFPLTWSSAVTTGSLTNGGGTSATVSQNENVFTITPTTTAAYAGTFSITFSATDGVNGAVNAVGAFTLTFGYDWTTAAQQALLQPTNTYAALGTSCAIDGDTIIAGAPAQQNIGKAYVYTRSGTTWSLQQRLDGDSLGGNAHQFGHSVSIEGDTVVFSGLMGDASSSVLKSGSVFVYTRSGTTWSQEAKLIDASNSTSYSYDQFGVSIALSSDTIIIGAMHEDTGASGAGSAFIFTRSGTTWSQQQKIQAATPTTNYNFGKAVDIDGDTAIVGHYNSACIFTRSGTTWSQQQVLTGDDSGDQFGISVAIDGDTAIVGAWYEDTGGTNAGSAYIYTRSGTTWSQQQMLTASDADDNDVFGWSVAIEGNTVVVGAKGEDTGASGAGAAYIFTRDGTTWTQDKKIQASNPGSSDSFGDSVAIEDDTVVVGARNEDTYGSNAGAAYVFLAE